MNPEITTGSVKVMRSYDYCHFEVCLSSNTATTPEAVDELRKAAARLADKAVEQYKTAKAAEETRARAEYTIDIRRSKIEALLAKPESERTPDDKAAIKAYEDASFQASRRYDYQDEWEDDWDDSESA